MLFNRIADYIKKYLLPYGSQIKISETEKSGDYSLEIYEAPPTAPVVPSVTTAAASSITGTTAVLGGNVTSNGGADVNEYGIVWKTSTGPTISDNRVPMGRGVGAFSRTVEGLPSSTTIYIKAYAINAKGIAYGNQVTATMLASILSINLTNTNPTNAATIHFTAVFSKSITGLSASNFVLATTGTISGAAITGVTGSGTTYTITVTTGTGNGNIGLNLDNDTGLSVAIYNAPFTGNVYLVDKTAPTATITAHPASHSNSTTASFSFTGIDTGGSGLSGLLVQIDGGSYVSATSPKVFTGLSNANHTFNVKAVDNAGNVGTPVSYTWAVDTVAPTISSINRNTPSTTPVTNPSSLVYRVTFSEDVTGVDVTDFILTTTGATTATIASISSVSANVYDVTINSITGAGTLRLDLRPSGTGIVDLAGNAIVGGYTAGQVYTIVVNGEVEVTNTLPNSVITSITGITGYTMGGSVAVGGRDVGSHSSSLSSVTVTVTFTGTTILDGNCTIYVSGVRQGFHNITNGTAGATFSISGITAALADKISVAFGSGLAI